MATSHSSGENSPLGERALVALLLVLVLLFVARVAGCGH